MIEEQCEEHGTSKVLGIDCTLCKETIIIKSIDPKIESQNPSPNIIETLFHYENGEVLIDKLSQIKSPANDVQYRNIINDDIVIIGGGGDDHNYPINKIEDTDSELRVYITPPPERVYLQPHMQHIKDEIYSKIRDKKY